MTPFKEDEEDDERKKTTKKKIGDLVFYAQSTSTVIWVS